MHRRSIAWAALAVVVTAPACHGNQPAPPPPASSSAAPLTSSPAAAPSASAPAAPPSAAPATPPGVRALALPGAGPEGVFMDYIACDRATGRVWVPAGNTGSVDVIDPGDKVVRVDGFPTAEVERNGKKRVVGPSSVSLGDGVVYIGNRANSSICSVNDKTLARGPCVALESSPDGLAYVASEKELWVTTPRDKSITILDASSPAALKPKGKISLEGEPEGYAVDDDKHLFFTNLEDKDKTLVIDMQRRKVLSTFSPQCGERGPRGIAVDRASGLVLVACVDHVVVLDTKHGGKLLSKLDTGAGVDNIDYLEGRRELYIGAGKAAKLTVARLDPAGALSASAVIATAEGARNAVVDKDGNAYLTDAKGGRILVVPAAQATH